MMSTSTFGAILFALAAGVPAVGQGMMQHVDLRGARLNKTKLRDAKLDRAMMPSGGFQIFEPLQFVVETWAHKHH